MEIQPSSRDVWIRSTTKEGQVTVSHHMVWDLDLFLRCREAEATKTGGKIERIPQPPRRVS